MKTIGTILNAKLPLKAILPLIILLLFPLVFPSWNVFQHQKDLLGTDSTAIGGLGIKDLVRKVKSELSQAQQEMIEKNERAMFELKDFDMEVSFVVRAASIKKGKVEYELVAVEGENQNSVEKTQKLKLHWSAVTDSLSIHATKEHLENSTVIQLSEPPKEKRKLQ